MNRIAIAILAAASTLIMTGCGTVLMGYGALGDTISDGVRATTRGVAGPNCDVAKTEKPTVRADGVLLQGLEIYDSNDGHHIAWSPRPLWLLMQYQGHYDAVHEYDDAFTRGDIAAALVTSGFEFIELEGPGRNATESDKTMWSQFGGDSSQMYIRYSISTVGDPSCLPSTPSTRTSAQRDGDRAASLKPDQCVAAQNIKQPSARFSLRIKGEPYNGQSKHLGDEHPLSWSIAETTTNAEYAYLLRRENHGNVSCPPIAIRLRFIGLVQPTLHEQRSLPSAAQ